MTITVETLYQLQGLCVVAKLDTPRPILRGLELIAAANQHADTPAGPLLTLTDEEVPDLVTDLAIRNHKGVDASWGAATPSGMSAGVNAFTNQLLNEVREALAPEVETLVEALRPRFDATVEPIVTAVQQHGITLATTADEIVERRDPAASQALLDARDAWNAVRPLLTLRQKLSELLDLSPTLTEQGGFRDGLLRASPVDYSVAYAAGDNWSWDGRYYVRKLLPGVLDLFAVAEGGLRLNSPAEVQAKQQARYTAEVWASHPQLRDAPDEPAGSVEAGMVYPIG